MEREGGFDPLKIRTGRKSLVCTAHAAFALRADGTVAAAGENRNGECDVQGWRDIAALACGDTHTVGLKKDGTVTAVGSNEFGECDVSGWRNIVSISCSSVHTVGIKEDGTVVATGANAEGQCDVEGWSDIAAVACGVYETIGIRSDGSIMATREVSVRSKFVAREAARLAGVGSCGGAVLTDCVGHISIGMCIDYSGMGRIGGFAGLAAAACGRNHIAGILSDGRVEAIGQNDSGQLDTGDFRDIIDIACGADYTVGLSSGGTVTAAGNTEHFDFSADEWKQVVELGGGDGFVIGIRADGTAVMTGTDERKETLGKAVAGWNQIDPEDRYRREVKGSGACRSEIPLEAERNYDILVNDDDEILISIKAREKEPEDPVMVYAGGLHALLYRDSSLTVILDYVNQGVRDLLHSVREVLIVELGDGEIVREYMAPVGQGDVLPIPEEKLPD